MVMELVKQGLYGRPITGTAMASNDDVGYVVSGSRLIKLMDQQMRWAGVQYRIK